MPLTCIYLKTVLLENLEKTIFDNDYQLYYYYY